MSQQSQAELIKALMDAVIDLYYLQIFHIENDGTPHPEFETRRLRKTINTLHELWIRTKESSD